MGDSALLFLSVIVFLPAVGAIALAFMPSDKPDLLRTFTLAVTALVLLVSVFTFFMHDEMKFDSSLGTLQKTFNVPWIPSFDIYYFMGVDGISFPLVILTAAISMLAMGASWSITKHVKGYCILFLLLETGMLGVFMALDFFLFYVFWEVMLLPMYFLIGVWGGPRREYAAIKFFLYTLVGSVFMLIAILMIYFHSDLRQLVPISDIDGSAGQVTWSRLNLPPDVEAKLGRKHTEPSDLLKDARILLTRVKTHDASRDLVFNIETKDGEGGIGATYDEATNTVNVTCASGSTAEEVAAVINEGDVNKVIRATWAPVSPEEEIGDSRVETGTTRIAAMGTAPLHTFSIPALSALAQHTKVFPDWLQWWAFLLLFVGFAIKVPSVPVHTWLPDAHVEAPTPISMILAGVLLKMGGYGIIRICYPICPLGGYELMWFVCIIGVVSMVYGAFAALAQKDFKRMVAYSSVSHMGYVVLGLGVWSSQSPDFWNMGIQGAMFQMIAHGISSAGMFFMVGVVYDRVHHRDLERFGGIFGKMPAYTALAIGLFFAGMGLPGLCGFIGEVLVVLSVWNFSSVLAIISAAVVILTAAYILWAIQRVYLGVEYKGDHEEALVPANSRELTIAGTLFVLSILFGVFPHQCLLGYLEKTVEQQVEDLVQWEGRMTAAEKTADAAKGDGHPDDLPEGGNGNGHPEEAHGAAVGQPKGDDQANIGEQLEQVADLN